MPLHSWIFRSVSIIEHLKGFEPEILGKNCEIDTDECALGYCTNGSVCKDRINDYECDCEGTGYTGKRKLFSLHMTSKTFRQKLHR